MWWCLGIRQLWFKIIDFGDFPGDPVVKTSPSIAEGVGWIPDQEAKIHALWPKPKTLGKKERNRNSVVTNSAKTLEVVHIKKKKT